MVDVERSRDLSRRMARPAIIAGASFLLLAAVLFVALPQHAELWLYGLYSAPSHALVTPFPHEPALFQIGKTYPPWAVACTGVVGLFVVAFFDYWLLGAMMNSSLVQPKLHGSRMFRAALRFFAKAPFIMLWLSSATFPFYPFKFLAIAGGYPFWRYELAIFMGRWPRFFILAWVGHEIQIPGEYLFAAAALIVVVAGGRMAMQHFRAT